MKQNESNFAAFILIKQMCDFKNKQTLYKTSILFTHLLI